MKIVICHHDCLNDVGGVSTWVRRIAPLLAEAGMKVIVHLLRRCEGEGDNERLLREAGIFCRSARFPVSTDSAAKLLWKWALRDQPDIYVPNAMVPAYYTAAWVKAAGGASLGVLHSDDSMYHGILDQFVNGTAEWQLSGVVSVSSFLDGHVGGTMPTRLKRVIPCGVPLPAKIASRPEGEFRLVYLGRLVDEQKQISAVATSMCRAAAQHSEVRGWIIGDGSQREKVREIVSSASPEGRVELLPPVASSRIYEVLRQCHALVLLSDYEGLPVCVMEAMAAGVVPVCLQTRSGVGQVVKHGKTGLLVENRDGSFDQAVATLVSDPGLWLSLSDAGRTLIATDYSVTGTTESWIELIQLAAKEARFDPAKAKRQACRLPPCPPSLAQHDPRLSTFGKLRHSPQRVKLGAAKRRIMNWLRSLFPSASTAS